MIEKKTLKNDERAVSPVIGEILMVAIVVILAAVIGTFVFGMVGTMEKTYLVGATASQSGEIILVTYTGGPDENRVTNLTFRGITSAGAAVDWDATQPGVHAAGDWNAPTLANPEVKDTVISKSGTTGRDHILVSAVFTDGTTQLIMDTYV